MQSLFATLVLAVVFAVCLLATVVFLMSRLRATAKEKLDIEGEEKRMRSEEHTSELQSRTNLVCRLLLEKKNYHCC